jgi:tricorn protease interacting factor F2/3
MKPIHYDLYFIPDLNEFTIQGKTKIHCEFESPEQSIILNVKELEIHQIKVESDGKTIENSYSVDLKKEEMTIKLTSAIIGQCIIFIEYSGIINDQLMGWYRSKYTYNSETKYIAVTQFEEREARRAFPCFDHPAFKSTFDIKFEMDADLQAIGNTLIESEELLENGNKIVSFKRTPKMCTYILFFGIGDFEFLNDETKKPLIRVAGPPGSIQYGKFGLDMARKSMDFCEEYMGVPYPLGKCDHIVVADFAFGAMENWGAVTYRENYLLVIPGKTSKMSLLRLASVIAHETSHMWFGNLVSPVDWKYLWLNESFASYFTYAVPDKYYPKWQMWDHFVVQQMLPGFERDSYDSTVPIELPKNTDDDEEIFIDSSTAPIIYNKGASILRMLVDFLGIENFKKGTQHYMEKYQYKCASSPQFWDALEEATQQPVKNFANSWVYQTGYPLISVERNKDTLKLIQRRFSYFSTHFDTTWYIPVKILCYLDDKSQKTIDIELTEGESSVKIPINTVAVKLNSGQTGFYRVKYSNELNQSFSKVLKTGQVSPLDRFGILNDYYTLVKRGNVTITNFLDFIEENYLEETDNLILIDLCAHLRFLALLNDKNYERISSLGKILAEKTLKIIGYDEKDTDSVLDSDLRDKLLRTAALFNSKDAIDFGMQQFEKYLMDKPIPADILGGIFWIGARHHSKALEQFQSKITDPSTSETERQTLLSAMSGFNNEIILKQLLEFVLENVPMRNTFIPITAIAVNPISQNFIWDWLQDNYNIITKKIAPSHLDRLILGLIPYNAIGKDEEVNIFLQKLMGDFPQIKSAIPLVKELLQICTNLSKME